MLYHYDFSPFSEKVRLVFGLKGLSWRSVVIPSVLPKPDLVALTGGYRHTPVLQMGADVFCDTRVIIRELDRRWPNPLVDTPGTASLAHAVEAWAERDLFWPLARWVTAVNAENLPPEFHADRAALRGRQPPALDRVRKAGERAVPLVRAQLAQVEDMLLDGRAFLLATAGPSRADLAVYHGLWFLGALPLDCSDLLHPLPRVRSWMKRVAALGHGTRVEFSAAHALEVAAADAPGPIRPSAPERGDPPLGTQVAVCPDDYATEPVMGELVVLDPDEVALRRRPAQLGEVVVHFPRVGYALRRAT